MTNVRRLDAPGLLQHVIARGVHGDRLVPDANWGVELLNAIAREADERDWDLWSLCVMGTHYHLLVATPDASLAAGLQRAHTAHALRRNRLEERRRGAVFGRRYTAIPIRDPRHLQVVIRYVALNPVRARLCRAPGEWQAGTFRALAGLEPAPRWLAVDRVYGELALAGPAEFNRWVHAQVDDRVPPLQGSDWTRYDILESKARGDSTAAIAARLGVSPRHVRRILATPPAQADFRGVDLDFGERRLV